MKNDKLIPGLVLVLIGAGILLSNYGYLHFHWWNIVRLWPIFLVIGGVNLVFANNKSPWATVVKVSVLVIGLGLLFFGNFGERYNFWPGNHFNYSYHDDNNNNNDNDDDDDNDDSNTKMVGPGTFNEPYKADIKVARLNVSGGGTSYNLSDTTNQLFSADTKDHQGGMYNFSHNMQDSVYVIDFKMRDHHNFNFDSDKNKAYFRLNPNPEWQINVETGAASVNFDLSKFKVRELKLHGGAASFKVRLGQPLSMTDVDVATGVSGVDISIPKDAACSIETESGLSDNHFEGFNKTGDNNYETPGFNTAKNKMHIHIKGGLSGFNVNKY
jgi:hypothetical protein